MHKLYTASLSQDYNLLDSALDISVSSHLTQIQGRITELIDYRIYGSKHEENLLHLYSNRYEESHMEILRCGPFDHTMFDSIDTYCLQKFPVDMVKEGLLHNWEFEVHGIFPDHFAGLARQLGYEILKEVDFQHNIRKKRFNFIRPKFFLCKNEQNKNVFVVAVNSGHDYVFHYASMLKHIISLYSVQKADLIKVIRYPLAESSIHVWTKLNSSIVKRDDLVIIGYVEEIDTFFQKADFLTKTGGYENEFYTSIRYTNKNTNTVINLIGVKFSFWGCISAKLVTQMCRLGSQEIIYVGKLGTLSSPKDIYTRIFSPSDFLIMYHDKVVCVVSDLKNNFLTHSPEMSTGLHVSVPTVVEEDYVQREITAGLKINSIDNEVSQIAYSVAKYNREFDASVSFTPIHFATDYIRRPDERDLLVEFDLSNNRTKKAFTSKMKILGKISKKLLHYLQAR